MKTSAKSSIFAGGRTSYILASLLLLAPCYWQPRIQGGDLSSNLYNAWMAHWLESGGSQGLLIVHQTTNVLFNFMLEVLFQVFNAEFAQRIAVSIAVLVFVWGAFAFVSSVAGRKSWHLLPCIAMFAYGWVFHMGFFNFYLSLGLCFWILSLVWQPTPRRIAFAVLLGVLAYVAHILPFLWTFGLVGYLWLEQRVSLRVRAWVAVATLVAIVSAQMWISRTLFLPFSPRQMGAATGLDQVWLFDSKYYLVLAGLVVAWGVMFLEMLHDTGGRRIATSLPFQICILSAMGVALLPSTVLFPGITHALVYVSERMSLGVAICVCALLGAAPSRPQVRYGLLVVSLIFFGFLYGDERKRNAYEDGRQDTVAELLPGTSTLSTVGLHLPQHFIKNR